MVDRFLSSVFLTFASYIFCFIVHLYFDVFTLNMLIVGLNCISVLNQNIFVTLVPAIMYSLVEYSLKLKMMCIFDRGSLFFFITLIMLFVLNSLTNPGFVIEEYSTLCIICFLNSIPFIGFFIPFTG